MLKNVPKIKDTNHEFAISIKKNYESGMKPKDIAHLFNLSKQRVNYWIHHPLQKKEKKGKINKERKNYFI